MMSSCTKAHIQQFFADMCSDASLLHSSNTSVLSGLCSRGAIASSPAGRLLIQLFGGGDVALRCRAVMKWPAIRDVVFDGCHVRRSASTSSFAYQTLNLRHQRATLAML